MKTDKIYSYLEKNSDKFYTEEILSDKYDKKMLADLCEVQHYKEGDSACWWGELGMQSFLLMVEAIGYKIIKAGK